MQIIEIPNHDFFIGAQFHPEFKSRPGKPAPLFLGNTTLLYKKRVDTYAHVILITTLLGYIHRL
jgi:CTP synthase (UTP-ammonia lyase)